MLAEKLVQVNLFFFVGDIYPIHSLIRVIDGALIVQHGEYGCKRPSLHVLKSVVLIIVCFCVHIYFQVRTGQRNVYSNFLYPLRMALTEDDESFSAVLQNVQYPVLQSSYLLTYTKTTTMKLFNPMTRPTYSIDQ